MCSGRCLCPFTIGVQYLRSSFFLIETQGKMLFTNHAVDSLQTCHVMPDSRSSNFLVAPFRPHAMMHVLPWLLSKISVIEVFVINIAYYCLIISYFRAFCQLFNRQLSWRASYLSLVQKIHTLFYVTQGSIWLHQSMTLLCVPSVEHAIFTSNECR